MSNTHELIKLYNAMSSEDPRKMRIIFDLSCLFDDESTQFLGHVALDKDEFDFARIEALKELATRKHLDQSQEIALGEGVVRLICDKIDDTIVRQHAALTLYRYLLSDRDLVELKACLLDPDDDLDIKYNVLTRMSAGGKSEPKVHLLESLSRDPEIGSEARRILAEWN